jgi:lysyl-tRNA synthetase class 1
LERAKFWLEQCAPDQVNRLRETRNFTVYNTLDEKEKEAIAMLHAYIAKGGYTLDDLNAELYAIPKRVWGEDMDQKVLRGLQGKFFRTVYQLLIDKETGPRLYLFLYAIEAERYVGLLDFAAPQTEAELAAEKAVEEPAECCEEAAPTVVHGEPDPVEPVKEQVTIDDFAKMDFRVCKVLKAETLRKSNACLKLTLFDGIGERVIMSSIKAEYTPEMLIGKKIIVVANLKPATLCGIESNGMILASGEEQIRVVFLDPETPLGERVR